ncbi:MAG: efflux RND transporter permease subunit [Acidobacteriota bacterium]
MSFTEWMQRHRRSLFFFLVVLMAGGAAAVFRLPVSLFPRINFPRVRVSLDAGDRPADRMVIEVTRPVEEAVRGVPGVREVRSTTSRGSADIDVNFGWGQDMVAAMLQVTSAIAQIAAALPQGTSYTVIRMDPTVFPVLAYSLTSKTLPLATLRDIALYELRPVLSRVHGVARIGVQGGLTEEYRVTADPVRLEAAGLTLDDVAKALSAANTIQAVGRLEDHDKLYLVLSDTQFETLDQIGQTVLRSGPGGVVRLKDVAEVRRDTEPNWTRVTADGREAVLLTVYQQLDGNTVQIARDGKEALAAYKPRLPTGVRIANWYDQSRLILSSAGSVRDALLVGVLMAALILWAFLRSTKVMLIAILTVPGVLAITVLLLYVLHMSFNVMTLGGMAAAVGLIIDDAIVMVEHIIRRMRGGEGPHHGRVMKAAREFTRPLAGSSAATIIIFAPLAFLSGVTGAFFKALSLTMAASLVISFLVAWLAVPLLADKLLDEKDAAQREGGPFTQWLHQHYDRLMRRLFARPALVLFGLLPLLLAGYAGYRFTGSGFMPVMDEGGFILDYHSAPGTSLAETDRLLRKVEAILRATPEVDTYSRRTGIQLGGMVTEANEGDFFVRLKPLPRRNIESVMEDVRNRVEKTVPGLSIEMAQLMEDLIGDLTAVPQPIEIKLYSEKESELLGLAPKVAAAIAKVPGVVDVRSGIVLAGDALDIRVDRARAALEGVDPEAVTQLARQALEGVVTTQVQQGPKMVGVRLWIPAALRKNTEAVRRLLLRAPDGHLFPLDRVAEVVPVTGQPQITRDDLKRMVAVTGRISGRDMGSTVKDVKRILAGQGLIPKDVDFTLGGLYHQQQIAFAGLMAVFLAAVALLFLLLLFLFERLRPALGLMLTTLMALCAVFVGLWATGTELNISSMMGMTMVLGIVTEVAIFLVWEFLEAPAGLDDESALLFAGKHRMRAITMSTLAAVLALSPLAFGIGQGSAMQQPLAIAIISGLLFQLPLIFLLMPILFRVLGVKRS